MWAVRECGVPLMTFDPDYAGCIIPAAGVRTSVGKACEARRLCRFREKQEQVIYRQEPPVFTVLDRLYNYCWAANHCQVI